MQSNNKLKKNQDFRMVYQKGKSMANRLLIIYIVSNHLGYNRIGFTVSKKVGNSVVRSRVKRLMKESYRLNEENIKTSYDIVFIARPNCKEATYQQVESALLHLIRRMKMLN